MTREQPLEAIVDQEGAEQLVLVAGVIDHRAVRRVADQSGVRCR
jgi:hypothetical protein